MLTSHLDSGPTLCSNSDSLFRSKQALLIYHAVQETPPTQTIPNLNSSDQDIRVEAEENPTVILLISVDSVQIFISNIF